MESIGRREAELTAADAGLEYYAVRVLLPRRYYILDASKLHPAFFRQITGRRVSGRGVQSASEFYGRCDMILYVRL